MKGYFEDIIHGEWETGNTYGSVVLRTEDGKYYWAMEDWDGYDWEEIPKYLFDAICEFNDECKRRLRG